MGGCVDMSMMVGGCDGWVKVRVGGGVVGLNHPILGV